MSAVTYQVACDRGDLPDEAAVARWVAAALTDQPADAELVVRVVGADEARDLNRAYRGRDYPTNVLSFPVEAPPEFGDQPEIGDLVICAEVVAREAAEQGKPLDHHWAHMVVHGALHCLGFDHMADAEAARMEDAERRILAGLAIPDPYGESVAP